MFKAQLRFIYLLSTLQTTDKTELAGPTGTIRLYIPTQGVYTPGAVFTSRVQVTSRYRFFMKAVCTRKVIQGNKPCHPKLPNITDLSREERKIALKQAMANFNEKIEKKHMEAAIDANLPALNANSHIKMKPIKRPVPCPFVFGTYRVCTLSWGLLRAL